METNDCVVCGNDPCACVCAKCGIADQSSYFPVDGGLERVSNLTFDSFPMDGEELDPKLFRAGWRHDFINEQHFRYRVTCRACLNALEQSRDVWSGIDKERKKLDSDAKLPDPYFAQLVGAEDEDGMDYWKNFSE